MSVSFWCPPSATSNAVLHVLDKVIKSTNGWTKKLPLGNTLESWKRHSPNFMCSFQSIFFEKEEHMNYRLNHENLVNENKGDDTTKTWKKSVEPSKIV